MTVSLTNKSRSTKVITLGQPAFRTREHGARTVVYHGSELLPDGTVRWKDSRRSLPGSLTLLPGATVSGLHPSIEHNRQVARLRAAGALELKTAPGSKRSETPQATPAREKLGGRSRTRSKETPE